MQSASPVWATLPHGSNIDASVDGTMMAVPQSKGAPEESQYQGMEHLLRLRRRHPYPRRKQHEVPASGHWVPAKTPAAPGPCPKNSDHAIMQKVANANTRLSPEKTCNRKR